jgi:predicted nucleic acid-binding protein
VIADASPLIVLARAGHLRLLRTLQGKVVAPPAVLAEVLPGEGAPGAPEVQQALDEGWLQEEASPAAAAKALRQRHPNLGSGEAEAIALAVEREEALLCDDLLARRAARLEGAQPVGTLGLLALAHHRGVHDRAATTQALRAVLAAGLWVGPEVVEAFWARLGGRP